MLTLEKIDSFLVNKLNFIDWINVLEKDREEFLKQLVKKHVCNVYFHNLGLAATEPDKRRVPSVNEILANGLTGNGGLCNQLNIFMKHLLDTLGIDAFTIAGTWSCSKVPGTHCMTIVKMGPDKMYLVDIASGSPNSKAIPLHELHTNTFKGLAGGYEYEFRLAPDGISYQRIQLKGSLIKGDFKDDEEGVGYSFQAKAATMKEMEPAMSFIYTDPQCYLFTLPFIFRHFDIEDGDGEDGIAFILVWGKTVVKGKRDSREIIKFESYDELKVSIINKHFPKLDQNCLKIAIENFKNHECIPYRY